MHLEPLSRDALAEQQHTLETRYTAFQSQNLDLNLTRGKPSPAQLDLSDALDGILQGAFHDETGTDLRNYGGLEGIPEARALFSQLLQVRPEEALIGGNSSLTLMYQTVLFAWLHGIADQAPWRDQGEVVFLCPVPGYDRHFGVCEHLGIAMEPVPMGPDGPDMAVIEERVKDPRVKGLWCVPRFSNPCGTVYSDAVVDRIARLGHTAAPDFRVFWDNAYAVHALTDDAPVLASLMDAARQHDTADSVWLFGSTSKITYAGAGLGYLGASADNRAWFQRHLGLTTIGPDKLNQLRHVRLLPDINAVHAHMQKHAAILRPKFEGALTILDRELGADGFGDWTRPQGGYFISFNTRPGLARTVVALAADAGVKLTPAGATFPYGRDPEDRNIRLAPSFPAPEAVAEATEVFACCVKLATVRQRLKDLA